MSHPEQSFPVKLCQLTPVRLTVFFFPYALLEIPSNMVLKLMRPSIWIGIMMVSWGVVMTLMGIVKDYHGLAGARVAVRSPQVTIQS